MTDLGILLSDMVVCVACEDVIDFTDVGVRTPKGEMCRRCAEEHDHGPLEIDDIVTLDEWGTDPSWYIGDEEVSF